LALQNSWNQGPEADSQAMAVLQIARFRLGLVKAVIARANLRCAVSGLQRPRWNCENILTFIIYGNRKIFGKGISESVN